MIPRREDGGIGIDECRGPGEPVDRVGLAGPPARRFGRAGIGEGQDLDQKVERVLNDEVRPVEADLEWELFGDDHPSSARSAELAIHR